MWPGLAFALPLLDFDIRQLAGRRRHHAPTGLILSVAAIAVLLATPSRSWAGMYR